MANTGAIRAGRAYVELFADSSKLIRGLRSGENALRNFGKSIQGIGTKMMGVGSAIVLPLIKAADSASKMGEQIWEMSKRTGVSVESLSALGFAAAQSGADIESLEKAFRFMHKNLFEAAKGSKSAAEALGLLGLTAADLNGLAPEEQFLLLADRIRALPDVTSRAAMAMKLFGKSGTNLLEMLETGSAGIRELMAEAKRLGLVMSTEDAAASDSFRDSLGKLWSVLKMGLFRVGSALIPILQSMAEKMALVGAKCAQWIKNNRGMIVTVLYLGAALVAGGAAVYAFGTAMTFMAGVLGKIISVFKLVKTAILWMISPLGALITLITAGAAAFLYFSGYGAKALSWLGQRFNDLKKDAIAAFQGIATALAKGNIALAAKIAWLTLKMEWIRGVNFLEKIWLNFKNAFLKAAYGAFYGAQATWEIVQNAIVVGIIEAASAARIAWGTFVSWWKKAIEGVAYAFANIYNWIMGLFDPNWDSAAFSKDLAKQLKGEFENIDTELSAKNGQVEQQRQRMRDMQQKDYEAKLGEIGQAYENEATTLDDNYAKKMKENADELASIRAEWEKAIGDARKPGEIAGPKSPPQLPDFASVATDKASSMGTFSGFALSQLGAGGVAQRIALAAELTAKNTGKIYDEMDDGAEFE